MIDRIFAPVLTFVMLIAGTAAIASGLFAEPRADVLVAQGMPSATVVLETVIITAKRGDAASQAAHTGKPAPAAVNLPAAEGRGVLLHRAQD
jgi:hypothetical protein